jgi:hypothetical protein
MENVKNFCSLSVRTFIKRFVVQESSFVSKINANFKEIFSFVGKLINLHFKKIFSFLLVTGMLLSNFYNNYIIQLRFDKMESNFLHVLKTNQEKFDKIQEMNLRMFKYILNNQTKKTPVVENINQTNPLLSESTQNNITTFISDNSTTILAVSAVVLAIVVYCYWQAPINAWLFSFFNNKPKDDDDKGNGGGSSDIGGNNDGGGSSECSSNAIIPYNELNLNINQKYSEQSLSLQRQINLDINQNYPKEFSDLQAIIDLVTPNLLSNNFVAISNLNGETLRIDLDVFLNLFPQVFLKDGIPFIRCTDNTEVPLSQLDSLELLFDNISKQPDKLLFDDIYKDIDNTPVLFSNFSNLKNSFPKKDYIALAKDPTSDPLDRAIGQGLIDLDLSSSSTKPKPKPLSREEYREMVDRYDFNDMEKTNAYFEKRIEMYKAAKKFMESKKESSTAEELETISDAIVDMFQGPL